MWLSMLIPFSDFIVVWNICGLIFFANFMRSSLSFALGYVQKWSINELTASIFSHVHTLHSLRYHYCFPFVIIMRKKYLKAFFSCLSVLIHSIYGLAGAKLLQIAYLWINSVLKYIHCQGVSRIQKRRAAKNSSSRILSHSNDVASFSLSFPHLAK